MIEYKRQVNAILSTVFITPVRHNTQDQNILRSFGY